MKLSQFKYTLPSELIALYLTKNRDESKLMVVHRDTGAIEHKVFKDIVDYFKEQDVLVFNNTKVFPARLYGNKEKTGAEIEVFLLRELNREQRLWDVLVDPARKIRIGNKLYFGEDDLLVAEVIDNTTSRGRTLRFLFDGTYEEFKEAFINLKLPTDDMEKARRNIALIRTQIIMDHEPSARANFQYIMEQQYQQTFIQGQLPSYQIFNAMAWAKFFQALKRGDFKSDWREQEENRKEYEKRQRESMNNE